MKRRTVLASTVPLSLAGCMRLQGGDNSENSADDNEDDGNGDTDDGNGNGGEDTDDGNGDASGGDDDGNGDSDGNNYSYPPGLSDEGVSQLLAGAHRNALRTTTAELEWDLIDVHPHGKDEHWEIQIGDGEAIGHYMADVPRTIHWAPDSGYWREEVNDGATFGRWGRGDWYDLERITRGRRLGYLIQAGDWNPPEWLEDEERFTIEASGVDRGGSLADDIYEESIETFEASGLVDADGIIRELDVEFQYVSSYQNELGLQSIHLEINGVDDTVVDTPDWVETARNEAPQVSATYLQNNEFIEFSMESGNPILPNTSLTIHDTKSYPTASGWGQLNSPIEAGDTLYMYLEDGVIQITEGEIPDGVSPEPLTDIAIWAHRGGFEYFFTAV